MKKIETIWHYLLNDALNERKFKHTQTEIASKFGYSLSTVNLALKIPSQMGAIRKASKFFVLEDFQKLLYFWASRRNLESSVLYKTRVEMPVSKIEGSLPPSGVFAAYSAAKRILKEPPADYSKVYFYINRESLEETKNRFPEAANNRAEANVFGLSMPENFTHNNGVATLPQTFVDIWNLRDWYAKDFTKALEGKMYGILS